jgi:hypothetical protein
LLSCALSSPKLILLLLFVVLDFLRPLSQFAFDAFKQADNVCTVLVDNYRRAAESVQQVIGR